MLDPVAYLRDVKAFLSRSIYAGIEARDNTQWVTLLAATSHYECSNDRDRLYALRGFLIEDVALSIPVDYKRSAKQILASACIARITCNRDLQFLLTRIHSRLGRQTLESVLGC